MPSNVTKYDLLVSCPGDVTDYLDVIDVCVRDFNNGIGKTNDSVVAIKHWSRDAYPAAGDSPQELLNEQFIHDCDLAVAIFHTRFGSPTDEYGSGTEEEIEDMITSGKQVFLYFSNEPVKPSTLNSKQYKSVQKYKENFGKRGIYWDVEDKDDFKKQFTNHLTGYFIDKIWGKDTVHNEIHSKLQIMDAKTLDINETTVQKFNIKEEPLKKRLDSIKLEFEELISNELSAANNVVGTSVYNNFIHQGGLVSLDKETIDIVSSFANRLKIKIDSNFFNFGNLTEFPSIDLLLRGASTSLSGTTEEKEYYEKMQDLINNIKEYNGYENYLNVLESISYLEMALTNSGNEYDEDIV